MHCGGVADTDQPAGLAQLFFFPEPVFLLHHRQRLVQATVIVTAVVATAGRGLVRKFVALEEIAPAHLKTIEVQVVCDPVDQPLQRKMYCWPP